jgi:hypothetical protein
MVSKTCSWILVAPLLLHFASAADKYIQDSDRFPGWKGELPHIKHGQPGEPDTVELAFGEHGKVGKGPNIVGLYISSLLLKTYTMATQNANLSSTV